MKRFITFGIICSFLFNISSLEAQCFDDKEIKFTGIAPSPWAIDGSVVDWQTILGSFTGDNSNPYKPLAGSGFNWAMDNKFGDLDHPDPTSDIIFTSFIHDDYNVYFYLRRLSSSNSPNSIYYFCDINSDGFMGAGEPVVGVKFNSQNVIDLTVYRYIPNETEDFVSGKGNWMISSSSTPNFVVDGYTMKGNIEKVFSEHNVPSSVVLSSHEIFKAETTENGYGIELSIPWKFLRNWNTLSKPLTPAYIFSYHTSMQKGVAPYQPGSIDDNAGNCCGFLSLSGSATYQVKNKSIVQNSDGLSYKLSFTVKNETNVSETIKINQVALRNILLNDGLTFNPADISIKVNGVTMEYSSGDFNAQPIVFGTPFLLGIQVTAQPFDSANFTVDISLPANHSISSLIADVNISSSRFSGFLSVTYCFDETGGGKTINPVGFTIETEESAITNRNKNVAEPINKDHSFDLHVYPNPNRGSATVTLPAGGGTFSIDIEDISGKTVQKWNGVRSGSFQLQNLNRGFYLLKVISGDTGKQIAKKIIVQ